MNQRTTVQAQAYYGEPVTGQRQSLVEGVRLSAGGVPFAPDDIELVVSAPAKPVKGKKKG